MRGFDRTNNKITEQTFVLETEKWAPIYNEVM
jgi:hypothetical protein